MAKSREVQEQAKWRAQDDMRTLENAAEIMKDKTRLNSAQAEAKRQMEALQQVAKRAPAKQKRTVKKRTPVKKVARSPRRRSK